MPDIELLGATDPRRPAIEAELAGRSLHLPVEHTAEWLLGRPQDSRLAVLREQRALLGAVPLTVLAPRAMPGHVRLRAERLGTAVPLRHLPQLVQSLRDAARAMPGVLDLEIDSYGRDPALHQTLRQVAAALGMREIASETTYSRTVFVDLRRSEADLLGSFQGQLRRDITNSTRDGSVVRELSASFAPRIDELHRETMARTGGDFHAMDWRRNIEFSQRHPDRSRINGLFLGGGDAPQDLVAVQWFVREGDIIRDVFGASTRRNSKPVMHAVIWDQLRWGQRIGAASFDFGGVPARAERVGDALDKIADFKRKFSKVEETVSIAVMQAIRPRRYAALQAMNRLKARLSTYRLGRDAR